jgi:amidohydrolase
MSSAASNSTKRRRVSDSTDSEQPLPGSSAAAAAAATSSSEPSDTAHSCPTCKRRALLSGVSASIDSAGATDDTKTSGNKYDLEDSCLDTVNVRPELTEAILKEMVENRRHLHQHPELSFLEFETAKFVHSKLLEYGIDDKDIQTGVAKTGVVAMVYGQGGDGPCVGLRADMDALPIKETTGLPFQSVNDAQHACGHDAHVATLLGVARVIVAEKKRLRGSVKLIFQPAEEGKGGAREMVKENVLNNPRVDEIYGLHEWNYLQPGLVWVQEGPIMAASDLWYVNIRGKGGHGAVPQGTRDAIVAASQLVCSLQTIVSRNVSPLESAVLTVGSLNAGLNYNVIAEDAKLSGTVRTLDEDTRAVVIQRFQDICDGISIQFGVKCELDYRPGYPVTSNRSEVHVDRVRQAAKKVVGDERVVKQKATMAAEDMSYFLNERPGCFFMLGSSPSKTKTYPHHQCNFTVHEDTLAIGASIFLGIVLPTDSA